MTESVRTLLQQIIDYPVDQSNIDAIRLQLLAARALLKLGAPSSAHKIVLAKAAMRMGQNGGTARAQALSPERRSEIAKKAAITRWST